MITRKMLTLLIVLGNLYTARAQDYTMFTSTIDTLYALAGREDIDHVWAGIVERGVPMTYADSVAFLYRGEANSVAWLGDFNAWGYEKNTFRQGTKIPGTDIWILKASFPRDARLDYKIVIDENKWILDPNNSLHQWSGVGGGSPNSELRMPDWKSDPVTSGRISDAKRGTVARDILFNSSALDYQVMYSVYTPPGYDANSQYPTVYVTDGYEYMHERMGNMVTIIDNLIHLGRIRPVVAVFIDNREPINRANNRRMAELALNEKYLQFVSGELVSEVERRYAVSSQADDRAIMGTSMGGLSAAFFAFSKPEVFGLAGIQSPAFWMKSQIYTLCDNPEHPPVKTFMSSGTINDTREGALRMKAILDKNTCAYEYREVNQGHSWGNWRDLIDDILVYFFGLD